jgi:hypothetical protein
MTILLFGAVLRPRVSIRRYRRYTVSDASFDVELRGVEKPTEIVDAIRSLLGGGQPPA